jgi:hypothetical protein
MELTTMLKRVPKPGSKPATQSAAPKANPATAAKPGSGPKTGQAPERPAKKPY